MRRTVALLMLFSFSLWMISPLTSEARKQKPSDKSAHSASSKSGAKQPNNFPSSQQKIDWLGLRIEPNDLTLPNRYFTVQLVVLARQKDGRLVDVTSQAKLRSENEKVATVDANGIVEPKGNGKTFIFASFRGLTAKASVTVQNFTEEFPISFVNDVLPVLSKAGCSQTGCHGSPRGKNGFKLSLFAAEPDLDYIALAKQYQMRRVNRVEPEKSLFLLKATGSIPHGGGERIKVGSLDYLLLLDWLQQGLPYNTENQPSLVSVEVKPKEATLKANEGLQFRVIAKYSDQSVRDVTRLTQFVSNTPSVASVDKNGRLQVKGYGEAVILAVYMGKMDIAYIAVPQPLPPEAEKLFAEFKPNNRIDELVLAKLRKLGIPPSPLTSDEEFIRRVYLDAIGTLPTPDEVRQFLSDKDPKKREKLIDALLQRPEFVDFWTLKWCDLLRVKRDFPIHLWDKGMWQFYRFVRESIAKNKPYDQFVRELILSEGSGYRKGIANFYRAVPEREPKTWAEAVSMVFMGVRLDCARCHSHPYEPWGQKDHHGLAAFFAKVGIKDTPEWGEQIVFFRPEGAFHHSRTGEVVKPKFLDSNQPLELDGSDPRIAFVNWLTSPENPYFARSIVNRIWFWLFGRGIVHEPDDFRASNPPSNPELLDFLAQELISNGYNLRHIFRLILNSRTYQTSSKISEWNKSEQALAHFARYPVKRLMAEQLLDAISQVCEHAEKFPGLPWGFRAIQLPDSRVPSYFLDLFGRPERDISCECERKSETALQHALYLVSSEHLERKVRDGQRIKRLLQSGATDEAILEDLWLAALARSPNDEEKHKVLSYVREREKQREQAWQDVLWALLNTKEFLFNH
ncbi:MAG: DUF1553 domain-containing protein [Armatimonadetes bacterium]|nr:DUF1553 domain-containing protein [Armatimonadota bacterium]